MTHSLVAWFILAEMMNKTSHPGSAGKSVYFLVTDLGILIESDLSGDKHDLSAYLCM